MTTKVVSKLTITDIPRKEFKEIASKPTMGALIAHCDLQQERT